MIRRATLDDVPAIAEMGARFHAAAGWADVATYSVEDCARSLIHMIESPDGIVLVSEDAGKITGIAGGLAFPLYFNLGHRSGQELFLYVEPGLRNGTGAKLLAAMEEEARASGCESWMMFALDKIDPLRVGSLYARRGYRAAEHTWIKRL